MKFTKDELLETLKAGLVKKVEKLSISDRTLRAQAETLYSFATEDDELPSFAERVLPSLVSLDGNYRKDNSDYVKKWNEEHPKKEEGAEDRTLSELRSEIDALKTERENERNEKAASMRREEIASKLKEGGLSQKWVSSYLRKLNVTKETDVDAEAKDAIEMYNASASSVKPSITPRRTGTAEEREDDSDVIAILKQRRGES